MSREKHKKRVPFACLKDTTISNDFDFFVKKIGRSTCLSHAFVERTRPTAIVYLSIVSLLVLCARIFHPVNGPKLSYYGFF